MQQVRFYLVRDQITATVYGLADAEVLIRIGFRFVGARGRLTGTRKRAD